jgi:hypothetical protein
MSASLMQVVGIVAVLAGGEMMIRLGIGHGQLQRRAAKRHCPCCGRLLTVRGCEHCGL